MAEPVPTFFDKAEKSFKDVPLTEDDQIPTPEFIQAAQSLVFLFDLLGSASFAVVQKDMTGNINKIHETYLKSPLQAATLQGLILGEKDSKTKTGTQGLLWLLRGLKFTAVAIRKNLESSDELTKSFTQAYQETLIKYHNMLIRPVFKLAMKAVPYRKDFYAKLGQDQDRVCAQLEEWLDALDHIVDILEKFYASGNYGKGL